MFPGAGAQIYYNEAGEPTGWDYPQYDEGPDPDDFDEYDYDEDPEDAESDDAVCDRCGEEFPPEQAPQAAEHIKTCAAELPYGNDDEFADERDNT